MHFSRLPLGFKIVGSFLKRSLSLALKGINRTTVYEGSIFSEVFNDAFLSYVPKDRQADVDYRKKLLADAKYCYLRWGFTPRDYFLFGFYDVNTSNKVRKTFVSDCYKDHKLFSKEGPEKYAELYDKFRFLKRIQPDYLGNGGNYCIVNNSSDKTVFIEFATRVQDLFIKPNASSYGNGAMCVKVSSEEEAEGLYTNLVSKEIDWLVEQRIIQDPLMAKWNVSSVNTVRINTILTNRGFWVLAPFMRTGRSGSIVDNGGKGGIYALIDEKTGTILTDGRDEHGGSYIVHPDSGVPYKGEQIPRWKELLRTVEIVHTSQMPDHIYISWDFALTERGWEIIEGNWGQFICQQSSSRRGFKPRFDLYMKGKAILR